MTRPNAPHPLSLALAGAAGGTIALLLVSLGDGLLRSTPFPPLADFSVQALGGAAVGFLLGLLRAVWRSLSPFGVCLGLGLALTWWLPQVSGSGLTRNQLLTLAASGALWLLVGAALGQLLGGGLARIGRALEVGPSPIRDSLVVVLVALTGLLRFDGGGIPSDPNLLLLTIDTLRSDRLGYAGHPDARTPHLDRLARSSRVSERAVTPLPRTLPAFVSLMTGRVPHAHGVRDNFHYALGPEPTTLAAELAERGWATAAVVSNPVLTHDSGVYRGFRTASDRGDDWSRLTILRGVQRLSSLLAMKRGDRAQVIADLALRWLDDRPRNRPFFLWVHWLSPHMPLEPVFPWDRVFDPTYDGPIQGRRLDYSEIGKGEMTYTNPLDARSMRYAKALYDGEVATADRALGRVVRGLELEGLLGLSVLVFTSDHGESLDEHGYFLNHGDFVYGPAANIPYFVRVPGAPSGIAADTLPSLVELKDRLLEETSMSPIEGFTHADEQFGESGFCRFPHLNDRLGHLLPRDIAQNPGIVADWRGKWEERANRAKQRFIDDGRFKLVYTPHPDGDRVELFDTRIDPAETRDVQATYPEVATRLRAAVEAWIELGNEAGVQAPALENDPDRVKELDALGYLGD